MKKTALLFCLSLLFCNPVMAEEPIRIAAIFSQSGEASAVNIEHLTTARMVVKEINANGGVLNRPIQLIEIDNLSTALGSRQAALEAIQQNVVAAMGGSWSSHALAMAPVFQEAGIPMISPIATNPGVTAVGNYIFRTCFIDSFQGEMLAKFAHEYLKVRKVAILTNVDQIYSIDLSRQFAKSFKALGNTVVAELDYVDNMQDFQELVQDLSTYDFQAVMLAGYSRESAQIIKTARIMGIGNIFFGGDGWSPLMQNYAKGYLNNTYYLTHWHKELKDPKTRAFMKKIATEFHYSRVNAGMALSYDTVYLLAEAMERAQSTEPSKIRDALEKTSGFIGVTGNISFDEHRNPIKPAVIVQFQDEQTIVVQQITP
ncbi:MAG: ABC transporter substrate-binding protein [Pseudomonadota bacterium]